MFCALTITNITLENQNYITVFFYYYTDQEGTFKLNFCLRHICGFNLAYYKKNTYNMFTQMCYLFDQSTIM